MRKALKSRADFFFVDAPHLAADASEEAAAEAQGSTSGRSWWQWTDTEPGTRPSRAAHYSGWEASQAAIEDAVNEHAPDLLLGFSQGATAAAMWMAHAAQAAAASGRFVERMPQGVILVGGFLPRDESYAAVIVNAGPLGVRSLHVTGSNDTLVPVERSAALWECFEEEFRTVYEHAGGHMVPTCSGEFKQAMVEFLDAARQGSLESYGALHATALRKLPLPEGDVGIPENCPMGV